MTKLNAILICVLAFASISWAQQLLQFDLVGQDTGTVQILSNDSLVFNYKTGGIQASGNAQVIYGDVIVLAGALQTEFESDEGESQSVGSFNASGGVEFVMGGSTTGVAQSMVSDLVLNRHTFHGPNIEIVMDGLIVMSDEQVIYDQQLGRLDVSSSAGQGYLLQDDGIIAASRIIVTIDADSSDSDSTADFKLEAIGNVLGDFDSVKMSADRLEMADEGSPVHLIGSVRVDQEGATLAGDCISFHRETGVVNLNASCRFDEVYE